MLASPAYIYSLSDPRSGEVRYVGKADDLKARFKAHLKASRRGSTKVYRWISGLRVAGLVPILGLLERCDSSNWRDRERFWVATFRSGGRLMNLTEGGDGLAGFRHSAESRAKMSAARKGRPSAMRGRRHSPETIAAIRAHAVINSGCFKSGHRRSPESIAKQRASIVGVKRPRMAAWFTPERRQAAGMRLRSSNPSRFRGKQHTAETRRKMSLAADIRLLGRVIRDLAKAA